MIPQTMKAAAVEKFSPVPGHEATGIVVALGPGVTRLKDVGLA